MCQGREDGERLIRFLRDMRALYVGEPVANVVGDGAWSPASVRGRFGMELTLVSTREFVSAVKAVPQNAAMAELARWGKKFVEVVEPGEKDLLKTCGIYLALRQLSEEYRARAIAMNCGVMREQQRLVPCLPFARLIDEGIISGCEGDVPMLLSMVMLHGLSRGAVLMGNFRHSPSQGISKGEVVVNHCIIPLSMSRDRGFRVRDFHGSSVGVTGYAAIMTGEPVTLLALSPAMDEMNILEGISAGSTDGGTSQCRVVVRISMTKNISVEKGILESPHMAMAFGHWQAGLREAAKLLSLRVNAA